MAGARQVAGAVPARDPDAQHHALARDRAVPPARARAGRGRAHAGAAALSRRLRRRSRRVRGLGTQLR
eukprot:1832832-Rhodomonas_salina.1